ncbi:hypothetical protein VHUM_03383 [Vanrija humicola]|uniref:Rho-GAP domain-containing protein n=1 Tax=Vanrija humicola TaxID=5417 RepID=A0A7D8UZ26_VANHU|nr:hypothetical protein VHUM_03383 [Vanrija humicola]
MADTAVEGRASRPLSEISENEDRRRASARVSSYSSSLSLKGVAAGTGSRPPPSKRASGALASLPVHTITLNLADYTGTVASTMTATAPATPTSVVPPVIATKPLALQSPSLLGSGAPSPTTRSAPSTPKSPPPVKPEKPAELSAPPIGLSSSSKEQQPEEQQPTVVDLSEPLDGISPLFVATRASLRPTASGKELQQPEKPPSPPATLSSTGTSFDSARSSIDAVATKAPPKSKAKWLKRASMAPLLGSKSVSPASSAADLPAESSGPPSATVAPPALPPRKFPTGPMDHAPTSGPDAAAYAAAAMRPPPALPGREPSSTTVVSTHHHPSASARSRWWGGQPTSTGVTRSASNNSIISTASAAHQRLPSGAQRVLGQAGNVVTKGWNRARGVGGSISGMGGFAPVRSNSNELDVRSVSPRNRAHLAPATPSDSFQWAEGVVKRPARAGYAGRLFGRELQEAGRAWTVVDAHAERPGDTEYEIRRRQCLPAIVVRAIECLIVWGPKEEGIFRISGRSSHLARLRREFDGGADLDLSLCDPGDLDPHSVAGIFKSYIRELPTPMVPIPIEQEIEELLFRTRSNPSLDELLYVLGKLPASHWFLLADVIMLLDFIPQHEGENRMTRQALMLSLGPTLRLSGDVVDVLVRHRQDLFRDPPLVDPSDLVDFGDESMVLPLSPAYQTVPLQDKPKPSASRRLSKRPSLGNLLGGTLMRRSQSDVTLGGFSPTTAPRLALPEPVRVDLPTFGGHSEDIDETEELESLDTHDVARATDRIEEAHYAPGTVAARAAAFGPSSAAGQKTPIADRFQRSSTERVDNLLQANGGSHSSGSSASSFVSVSESFQSGTPPRVNPIVAIRRSPPLFFASAMTTGTKRKDETNAERSNESARDSPKRLSSGPGPTDDDLAVRP